MSDQEEKPTGFKAAMIQLGKNRKLQIYCFLVLVGIWLSPFILAFLADMSGASRSRQNRMTEWIIITTPLMMGGFAFVLWCVRLANPSKAANDYRENIGGARVEELANAQAREGFPLGTVRVPEKQARLHTLFEGATGTGKTQGLKNIAAWIREQGDTAVFVDTGFDMFKTFGQPGDMVLSWFDPRSPGWSPDNEIRAAHDWDALAETLIEEEEGSGRVWSRWARSMFADIGRNYWRAMREAGEPFNPDEFFHFLTGAGPEELEPFLAGTSSANLLENEKMRSNVRSSFQDSLKFWNDLKPGNFSVRDWVNHDGKRPWIFIPHTKRTLASSRVMIATWLDQMISEACERGEDEENRVWIIIDELSSLGKIPALEMAVTELRKTGFRVIVGIQNFEQVQKLYTKDGAATVINNLSNKCILRANNQEVAERQSRTIGDSRVLVHKTSSSKGTSYGGGNSKSSHNSGTQYSVEEKTERAVLASEIMNLDDLEAYVITAGSEATYKTRIPIYRGEKTGGFEPEPQEERRKETEEPEAPRGGQPLDDVEALDLARKIANAGPRNYSQSEFDAAFGSGMGSRYMRSQEAMSKALTAHGLKDAGAEEMPPGSETYLNRERPITIAAA